MEKVLLIDSGTGGVNILRECVCVCPHCDFLLFCDTKNLPYGNKSKEELVAITINNLEKIRQFFAFNVVVLACNTLTSTCIDECREKFKDVAFVGTEPAVKPALKYFKPQEILVLATAGTIEHNKLLKSANFQTMAMPELASQIDQNIDNLQVLKPVLEEKFANISAKAVVLGCTHYVSTKNILLSILPPKTLIFDSENGVARRLKQLVKNDESSYRVQIMTSSEDEMRQKLLWAYFNL